MKELGINPKDYAYLKSDDKSTTLKHKKGHELTIAHNVLSRKNQEILKALAATNSNESTSNPKMAAGGKVPGEPGYADADEYYQQNNERNYAANAGLPCLNPNCKSHGIPHPNCRCYSGGESFAKGGKVSSHFCSESRQHKPDCEYSPQGQDVRRGDMEMAKKEAKGRSEEERYVKPKMKGMAEGGQTPQQEPVIKPQNVTRPDMGWGSITQKAKGGPVSETWNKDKPMPQDSAGNMMASEQCFDDGGVVDSAKKWLGGTFGSTPEPEPDIPGPVFPHDESYPDKKQKPQQKAKGGEVCHNCGTPHRKMYADPSGVVDNNDDAPSYLQANPGDTAQEDMQSQTNANLPEGKPNMKTGLEETLEKHPEIAKKLEHMKNFFVPSNDQGSDIQAAQDMSKAQNVIPAAQDQAPQQPNVDVNQDPGTIQNGDQANTDPTLQPQYNPQSMQNVVPADYQKGVQQELLNETNSFHQDLVNGHIGPKTMHDLMWKDDKGNDKSTLGKIGTIFGMLLAGAGSGLSHQPNALLSLMQKQIDNDLDAQKQSKTNAINYLRMNQQNEMNKAGIRLTNANANNMNLEANQKAYALARMQMNRAGLHKLTQDASSLPVGSPNRVKAEAALPLLYQAINTSDYDIADRAAAASTVAKYGQQANQGNEGAYQANQNGLRWGGMGPMADVNDQRHIPGIAGQSSQPIPQSIKDQVHAMNVLDAKGKDLLNFAKQHAGTWNPQTRAQAEQKLEEMKNFYNGSIEGGALTEGRLKWYDEQFKKSPTDILPQIMGSTKRLEEVVNSNQMRRDLQLRDLGFPKQQPMNQQGGGIKEGQTGMFGKTPVVRRGGKWVPQ